MRALRTDFSTLSIALICISFGACEKENRAPLLASSIEVTKPLSGMQMTAGYLTLTNNSSVTIDITKVLSDQYNAVEIHESTLDNGIARMRRVPVLRIAAGSSVTLERGGKHLMMIGPTGKDESVSLKFFSGDTLLLSIDTPLIDGSH